MNKYILLFTLSLNLICRLQEPGEVMATQFYGPIEFSIGLDKILWNSTTQKYEPDAGQITLSGPMLNPTGNVLQNLNGGLLGQESCFAYSITVEDYAGNVVLQSTCSGLTPSPGSYPLISCNTTTGSASYGSGPWGYDSVELSFQGKPGCYQVTYSTDVSIESSYVNNNQCSIGGGSLCSSTPPCPSNGFNLNSNQFPGIPCNYYFEDYQTGTQQIENLACDQTTQPICSVTRNIFLLPGTNNFEVVWVGNNLYNVCYGNQPAPQATIETVQTLCELNTTTENVNGQNVTIVQNSDAIWSICSEQVVIPYTVPLYQNESDVPIKVTSPNGTSLTYGGGGSQDTTCSKILHLVYTGCADGNANVEAAEAASATANQQLTEAQNLMNKWPETEKQIQYKYIKQNAYDIARLIANGVMSAKMAKWYTDRSCLYYHSPSCYSSSRACCQYCSCNDKPENFCPSKNLNNGGGLLASFGSTIFSYCNHC